MDKNLFLTVIGALLGLKTLVAVIALMLGWQAEIGIWIIPRELMMYIVIPFDAYLSWTAFRLRGWKARAL